MTRLPEIRIATIAALIIVCATTSSAAAIASHATQSHHRTHRGFTTNAMLNAIEYSVSMSMPDARTSVIASADRLYSDPKFDDLHGTTTVMRPRVQMLTVFRTRRAVVPLPPDVRVSLSLKPGQRKLKSKGFPALEQLTERIVLWDDVVMNRRTVSVRTMRAGKADVVLEGAPLTWQQFASEHQSARLVSVYAMEATAYTAWTATSHPTGRTATGLPAAYGVVAVDPHVIRLGSHVFVPGYGFAVAADTGGAIVGNRIDLCMESVRDAMIFGRRPVKVYLIDF